MLCFILFQLGAMTSGFSTFFWEAALSRGFCHHGLPPSQEGLFGIEVGTLCNGNSDQAPFSVDQVQHKNEY